MKIIVFIALTVVLSVLTAAFWWVKGQPVDWDGFFPRRGGLGGRSMHHPGNPLKKSDP